MSFSELFLALLQSPWTSFNMLIILAVFGGSEILS